MSTDIEKRWNCYMFNEEIIFARTSEQAKLAWCEWFDRAWPGGEPQQVENWMDYGSTQSLPGSRARLETRSDPLVIEGSEDD